MARWRPLHTFATAERNSNLRSVERMTRIVRISRLRNCGVFRDFTWPSDLPEFGRYNLIYGWNGTGKTTLSRLFRDLELGTPRRTGEAVLRIDGRDVRGESFSQSDLQVRVFNRDFVNTNVFPVEGRNMPPILVLGAENVEKQKEIERLKARGATARSSLESAQSARQGALGDLDRFCIDRARAIKENLRSGGENPYNNYNKASFQTDAEKMIDAGDHAGRRLTDTEREGLLARHRATPKPRLTPLVYALPDLAAIKDSVSTILATSVVSAAIQTLKDDPALAEWTGQGLALHRSREAEQCLFCKQSLPEDRLAVLEGHFSTQYEQFIKRIDQKISMLKTMSKASTELRPPAGAELYDDLAPEIRSSAAELASMLEEVQGFLEAAVQALEGKRLRVFEQIELDLPLPSVDGGAIEALNAVIHKHNQACDDFDARSADARDRLAADMIATGLDVFLCRTNAASQAAENVQTTTRQVQGFDGEIARLEREIVEHRRPAEELNEDLHSYLGHHELGLQIEETGYTITRGGIPAQTLSEGETTAIALLYFLKCLQDRRFSPENGVIVLDDPVSSLDANALFLAFGFIRERTKDAAQLFVLTHNFSFFRQVRNWFHHLRGQRRRNPSQRPARFFMLDSTLEDNARSSTIRWLDPLLEQYESEYQYLFARIHRATTEPASQGLEQNYVLPNMARRMLEAFLAFRQPQVSGDLWQKLKLVSFDEAKKLRILRFLHTHSHSMAVGEPEHDLTALGEGPSVLRDLLDMIRSLDHAHFSAMVELVATSTDSEENGNEAVTP